MVKYLIILFVFTLLIPAVSFGAVSYYRSPDSSTIISPVEISVSVDNFNEDFGFPENDYWVLVIADSDGAESFFSDCYPFSTLSVNYFFNLPIGDYTGVRALSYAGLDDCVNHITHFGYNFEGDNSSTIFTIIGNTTTTGAIAASTTSSGVDVSVNISAGTVITGPSSWNGALTLPEAATTFVAPTPDSGFTASVMAAITIGAGDTPLILDQAAKLTFAGQAGELVGWSRGGSFTQITATCDSLTTPTLSGGADCKIDSGSDLIVWTKHFTAFITYTQTLIPPAPVVLGGGGGGGGGGGAIIPRKTGDITGDNMINEYDLAVLMADWGQTGASPADLNHDGVVDEYDFALLMVNWGL